MEGSGAQEPRTPAARAPATAAPQPATDVGPAHVSDRRRRALAAGYGTGGEEAEAFLDDPSPAVRATALGALARTGALDPAHLGRALADPDAGVRRRACTEAGRLLAAAPPAPVRRAVVDLVAGRLEDGDPAVVEAAAWAVGEAGEAGAPALGRLVELSRTAPPLCREAAVAALGAIGDPGGLEAVLGALEDKPAVRRRATVALAAFDDPRAEAGLRRAAADRDWQVRQAAETRLAP